MRTSFANQDLSQNFSSIIALPAAHLCPQQGHQFFNRECQGDVVDLVDFMKLVFKLNCVFIVFFSPGW